jgi:hypothetical protein
MDVFEGRVTRRPGVSQDFISTLPVDRYRHFIPEVLPPEDVFEGLTTRRLGQPPGFVEYCQIYQQGFRIADSAFDLYELYVGEDTEPDFSATGQPVATSPTLPFLWTPTPPASGATLDLHLVVRKRNEYNLDSFNVFSKILRIDSVGSEVLGPVTAPDNVSVYDDVTDSIRVITKYVKSDDTTPADTWDVYVEVGIDPVPGVDTPKFTGSMTFLGEEAFLSAVIADSSFGAGDTVHVIVCAKRASDGEEACSPVVLYTLIQPVDLTDGQLFGGSFYEQR